MPPVSCLRLTGVVRSWDRDKGLGLSASRALLAMGGWPRGTAGLAAMCSEVGGEANWVRGTTPANEPKTVGNKGL